MNDAIKQSTKPARIKRIEEIAVVVDSVMEFRSGEKAALRKEIAELKDSIQETTKNFLTDTAAIKKEMEFYKKWALDLSSKYEAVETEVLFDDCLDDLDYIDDDLSLSLPLQPRCHCKKIILILVLLVICLTIIVYKYT